MNKLSLYFEKKIISSALIIIFSVTILLILLQSLRFLDLILNRGFSAGTLLYIALLTIPSLWIEVLPFALVLGIIFTWNSMINNQEMIVMQAMGVSSFRLSLSLIYIGIVFFFISLVFVSYVIPKSYNSYAELRSLINNSYNVELIEAGKFVEINPDLTFYVKEIKANEFLSIVIYSKNSKRGPLTLIAEKGVVDFEYTDKQVVFLLSNVSIMEINKETADVSFVNLDKYLFNFSPKSNTVNTERNTPSELYLNELIFYKNLPFMKREENNPDNYNRLVYNLHKESIRRIANALLPLIITIFTSYFFTRSNFRRQGNRKPLIQTLVTFGIIKVNTLAFFFAPTAIYLTLIASFFPSIVAIYLFYELTKPTVLKRSMS